MNDNPSDVPLQPIDVAELAAHVASSDVFVIDLRHGTPHKQIYGALRYDPHKLLAAERLALPLPQQSGLVVVYDEDGSSRELGEIGRKLRANGYGEMRQLEGGFKAYEAAGGKIEDATMEQPVPLVTEHQLGR